MDRSFSNRVWSGSWQVLLELSYVKHVVSRNQQKEQRRNAETVRRNELADELRERVLEVISPATWFHLAKWKSRPSPQGDGTLWDSEREGYTMKLTDSITRVCLMLDPEVSAHAELMKALEWVRCCGVHE